MLDRPPAKLPNIPRKARNVPALQTADIKALLRTMLTIRRFEQRTIELFHEGVVKGTAHSSVGQEAIAAGACRALLKSDFLITHHRGHGHTIAKGASLDRMMAELMGRVDGYCGGLGGSMHIADLSLNILGANGIVGAGMGLGMGAALAAKQRGADDVGIAFFGDGAANEGIFHEAMNMAAIWKLPLIFFCENNQYGLSTASADVTAGGSVAGRAAGYSVPGETIDGNDIEQVYEAVAEAASRARAGEGPTLIEAMTYRWGDHSMRANLPRYRGEDEEENWKTADPVARCAALLKSRKAIAQGDYEALAAEVDREVEASVDAGKASAEPVFEMLRHAVLAPLQPAAPEPAPGSRAITYLQAINEAMAQEMARDERVFVIGEDVGKIGGIFGATRGLIERFGTARVLDTPIAEQAIASAAVGAAIAGQRPIVEIQIFDFVTLMMDMIVNQAAKARFMLGGQSTVPVVFRGPQGGGVRLAAQHSQSLEAWFAHVPGLIVLAPSTPYDAKGLMTAAIRDDNPVIFLEHKLLYLGQPAPVPEAAFAIPIGKADIKRTGTDVTVIATMSMVAEALKAADQLARQDISVEVIDPRTLRPLDMETIVASIRKTHRCVIVHEGWKTGGLGGEISAQIMEQAFDWLDAPVARVCNPDLPMPYNDRLERAVIPSAQDIAAAVKAVCYRE
jgi:2-oxoisovalerate dehydrogenase E1 component